MPNAASIETAEHSHPHGWRRYLYSTNHKDIGTLYLIFAIFAGCVGALFSVFIRIQLMDPHWHFMAHLSQVLPFQGANADNAIDMGKMPLHRFDAFNSAIDDNRYLRHRGLEAIDTIVVERRDVAIFLG